MVFTPDPLPEPLPAVLREVRSWIEPARQASSAQERASWLAGLRELADAVECVFTEALGPFDAHGDGDTLHAARSTASWLRGALRMSPADAASRVQVARGTRGLLAAPMRTLGQGGITFEQVRAIERAVRCLPDPAKPDAVRILTDLAEQTDVAAVRSAGQRVRHLVDPDGALAQAENQFDRRYLHLSPLLDGMTAVDGLLDAEAATVLASALSPFLVPRGPDDHRSTAQRRADGLVDVARAAIDSDSLPELSSAAAQLQVVIPWSTITRAGPEPARLPDHPAGAGWLTPPAAQRLLCDASVSRVLLDADSVPLDLGRSHRLFTRHQRRALALRDDGCRFPGCPLPARYTDAHHVLGWAAGGHTDLPNALLLCRHHHRKVHEGGWRIQVDDPTHGTNATVTFLGPQDQQLTSPTRGP